MNLSNLTSVTIESRKYHVEALNPLEGIEWGNRTLALFGPGIGKTLTSSRASDFQGIDLQSASLEDLFERMKGPLGAALSALGEMNHKEVTAFMVEAIRRCYTPRNEPLSDEAVFNRWFREHPGDLYPLGIKALFNLVKDFFPSQLVTAASAFQTRTTSSADTQ